MNSVFTAQNILLLLLIGMGALIIVSILEFGIPQFYTRRWKKPAKKEMRRVAPDRGGGKARKQ